VSHEERAERLRKLACAMYAHTPEGQRSRASAERTASLTAVVRAPVRRNAPAEVERLVESMRQAIITETLSDGRLLRSWAARHGKVVAHG
jgi:hypothetical protein